jgi:hypothetical protein
MNPLLLAAQALDTPMATRHLWLAYSVVWILQFGYAAVIISKLCSHRKGR